MLPLRSVGQASCQVFILFMWSVKNISSFIGSILRSISIYTFCLSVCLYLTNYKAKGHNSDMGHTYEG